MVVQDGVLLDKRDWKTLYQMKDKIEFECKLINPDAIFNLKNISFNITFERSLGLEKIHEKYLTLRIFTNRSNPQLEYIPITSICELKPKMIHIGTSLINHFPDKFYELTDLRLLNLYNNNIQKLPMQIKRLEKLEHLSCSNSLTDVSILNGNQTIKCLLLGNNKLTTIPSLGSQLLRIDFFQNHISDFSILCQNTQLYSISLSNNPIEFIPEEISELKNMCRLILGDTKIEKIPDSIAELENLVTLDIRNLNIDSIPFDFDHMKNLQEIVTLGTKIKKESLVVNEGVEIIDKFD